jgi:hypothetical protein
MKEKERFRTTEQIEAKKQQQAAWAQRKTAQRAREKAAEDLFALAQDRPKFLEHNRAALKPEELAELERRQAEFLEYFGIVSELIEKLNTGAVVGEPSGLPYPDIAYQETKEYILRTSGTRFVFRPSAEEFVNIHEVESNPKILQAFRDADPDFFTFGFFTVFTHACWIEFLNCLAKYIKEHPADPMFDQAIAAKVLIEARGHVPVRRRGGDHGQASERSCRGRAATGTNQRGRTSRASNPRKPERRIHDTAAI